MTCFRSLVTTSRRVFQQAIARADLDLAKSRYPVISTRLYAGQTLINVVADTSPGAGFEPVEATLEDVYFAAINGRLPTRVRETVAV